MTIDDSVNKAHKALKNLYSDPTQEAVATLSGNILIAQATEKLADAILSKKGPRTVPLVDPKDRRMD
jgi:hypothetical protein